MNRALAAIAIVLGACAPPQAAPTLDSGATQTDAGKTDALPRSFVDQLAGKKLLWVGAHPDDESTVAPLLGEACNERGARCSFLVMTQGEGGSCFRAERCSPDLATVRVAEMKAAAVLVNGTVVQWDFGDGKSTDPNQVAMNWAALNGGPDALIAKVRGAIEAAAPDVVFLFDPRHGTTCHADHRAAAGLVTMALKQMGAAAPVAWLAEVKFLIGPNESTIGYGLAVPDDTRPVSYDATRSTAGAPGGTWDYLLANLKAHRSQFASSRVAAFAMAPSEQRRVFLLSLEEAQSTTADQRYDSLCN